MLFCAPTNVAVDNLVVKLGETQFKPLRTGNVLRMSEEARPHSLDYKMRRHKDYKAIRILEKKIKRGNYNRKLVLELGMRKAALIRLISRDYRVKKYIKHSIFYYKYTAANYFSKQSDFYRLYVVLWP